MTLKRRTTRRGSEPEQEPLGLLSQLAGNRMQWLVLVSVLGGGGGLGTSIYNKLDEINTAVATVPALSVAMEQLAEEVKQRALKTELESLRADVERLRKCVEEKIACN